MLFLHSSIYSSLAGTVTVLPTGSSAPTVTVRTATTTWNMKRNGRRQLSSVWKEIHRPFIRKLVSILCSTADFPGSTLTANLAGGAIQYYPLLAVSSFSSDSQVNNYWYHEWTAHLWRHAWSIMLSTHPVRMVSETLPGSIIWPTRQQRVAIWAFYCLQYCVCNTTICNAYCYCNNV